MIESKTYFADSVWVVSEKRQDCSTISAKVIYYSQEYFDKYNIKDKEIEKYRNSIEKLKEDHNQKGIEVEKKYEDIKKLTLKIETLHTKFRNMKR